MSLSQAHNDWCRALTNQHPALVRSLGLVFPTTPREGSLYIETIKVESLNRYGNRAGSMRAVVADRLVRFGLNVNTTFSHLEPMIGIDFGYGTYQRKLEFSSNVNGRRIPKPLNAQREELLKLIGEIAKDLRRREVKWEQDSPAENSSESAEKFPSAAEAEGPEGSPEPEAAPEEKIPTPEITGFSVFMAKLREIRRVESQRSEVEGKRTPILEAVSGNRPSKNGAKMFKEGIPVEALLHSLALDWPAETRSRYGIGEYDVTSFRNGNNVPEGRHPAYSYVRKAMDARVPVALIGPSGTGKSTLCVQIAKDMGLPYGMVPMTAGATPSWIVGAYTLDGYRTRSAVECFVNGGIFVFEEMDSADPNMLLVANNLIENDVFINPVTNEELVRHEDYIPVACMNTRGLGATATNSGRSRLDDATRNRFAMGRVELFLSEEIEDYIVNSILSAS